jgi:hypothetical protein
LQQPAKSDHKRLAHRVGTILGIAHQEAAPRRAKTRFAPTCCLGQYAHVVWFKLGFGEVVADSVADEITDGVETEFSHDLGPMRFHGFDAEVQSLGDRLVALSLS